MAVAPWRIAALLVLVVGHSPGTVFSALYRGSVSSPGALGRTLDDTIPVLLVALGTLIAVRAGMFNIGQTGQLRDGRRLRRLCGPEGARDRARSSWCSPWPAGAVGGAVWAGIAAWLYTWRGINVVISTLLLTYVATQILNYAVSSQQLLEEPRRARSAPSPSPRSSARTCACRTPAPTRRSG